MDGIEQIDQQITLWINSHYCTVGDCFWSFMSQVKIWFPLYAVVAALLVWRLGWKKGLICIACIALAFFFDERVCNLIKDIVERVRPCNNEAMLAAGLHVLEQGGGFSCPSGHACNSFGFALGSALCLKKDKKANWNRYSIVIMTWAFLVGISRIMVGRHFFGDVIIGAVIGILMALLWVYIAGILSKKVKNK